jgi:hypothetical protein
MHWPVLARIMVVVVMACSSSHGVDAGAHAGAYRGRGVHGVFSFQPLGSITQPAPARIVVVVFMASSSAPGIDGGAAARANGGRGAHGHLSCVKVDAERPPKCCLSNDLNERARGVVPSLGPGAAGEDNPLRRRDERSVERASAAGEGRRARDGVRGSTAANCPWIGGGSAEAAAQRRRRRGSRGGVRI